MAYGLAVDNILITDKGLLVADVLTITSNSSKTYPLWSGRTLYYSLVPVNNSLGHVITISNNVVSWVQTTTSGDYFPDTPQSILVVYVR